MDYYFDDSLYKDCGKWISKQLDDQYDWSDIEMLCVSEDKAEEKLESLIENEMWPEELTLDHWKIYVAYYKKLHPAITISKHQKIVGIDKNGLNNTFEIPSGVASTWERYKESLSTSLGIKSVIDIEKSCQWIMNHLKDDTGIYGPVKGLVTGSVQSGKTANMAGLVSMAADCNWNFFIILSGTIDNLRKQTRDTLYEDPEFIEMNERGRRMYSAGLNNYYRFASGEGLILKKEDVLKMDMPLMPDQPMKVEQTIWKRSNILRMQALTIADFSCEIDKKHESFTAENTGKPYMEGHHAIPMRFQSSFDRNLDVYANIVCLCPICHRKIHFGMKDEKTKMIHQIYEERAERLAHSGIELSRDEFTDIAIRNLAV